MTQKDSADSGPVQKDYQVVITNCNTITEAKISLRHASLNIKYGPNGLGKSTIAHALALNAEDGAALDDLMPFKFRGSGNPSDIEPSVSGAADIQSVLVFDEHYVSQFVFQPDEVLKNSFEVFINTPEYQAGITKIEALFEELKDLFAENEALEQVIRSLSELRDAFTLTKSGAIAKTSRGFKALGMGGKLESVPAPLKGYEEFLKSADPAGWISWQSRGRGYLGLSGRCPFCSVANVDKAIAVKVSEEYESAAVKNMSALRSTIDGLSRFFEPSHLDKLRSITTSLTELSPEQDQFLASLRGQIETLLGKFSALRSLSFHVLRDVADIDSSILDLKIDLSLLAALDSDDTRYVVDGMNEKLDHVAEQVAQVKARIGEQKSRVAKSIRENQAEVNEFLVSAGYKYSVRFESNAASYQMILEHQDAPGHIEAAARHLSFGERNAFALVLFMHHVRREEPDLVVLDDPVSSFDKTKKFAILHKLFHGKTSLRGSTTLLLTHDIEPAIDVVRTATSGQFLSAAPIVHFLRGRSGIVSEKQIHAADLMTFSQVCDANIAASTNGIIKAIYLRRRFEVHGEIGAEYEVLSSLLHLREEPSRKQANGQFSPFESAELDAAYVTIRTYIPGFDYEILLADLSDIRVIKAQFDATDVGYEKVQLVRIALALYPSTPVSNPAFKKFVNESYHIENEYVMQLNPRDFDAVPEYVIESCAQLLEQLANAAP